MANFGTTQSGNKTSFTLYSKGAAQVILRLFEPGGEGPFQELPLEQERDTWTITLENLPEKYEYAYKVDGKEVLDPYANRLNDQNTRAVVMPTPDFDWENNARPMISPKEMILYEMHVGGFTKDPSSGVKDPGTYLGVVEKIPYLKKLGVNAIELLPIHTFTEKGNFWGYSTANFFTPMNRYGTPEELKEMIKAFHSAGIEVILDVVYNHTDQNTFQEIDPVTYYIVDENGYHNYSGCGNTLNCNHPIVQQLILDSLRHFVTEYHVDGFRFDLAPILTRGEDGTPLEKPPLIEKMNRDPILGPTKLIAEPWDGAGLCQAGSFPSHRFGEWNGQFRDDIRSFISGRGSIEKVKKRLMGSPDLYSSPEKSFNFVTIHDGLCLKDLVSSWDQEGEQQMKNCFHALFIAQGVPILLMGDEYGHTKKGNDNTYDQDNELNYFLWNALENNRPLFGFVKDLITFRKKHLLGKRTVEWFEKPSTPFLALLINDRFLSAFNPTENPIEWSLPAGEWNVLFDTTSPKESKGTYMFEPYSSALLAKE